MTNEEKKQIRQFEARVRQLILQYTTLQATNQQLSDTIAQKQAEITALQQQLDTCKRDYETLKTAKMMEISDGDINVTRQRITRLVREINKCIALITNEGVANTNTESDIQ